MGFKRAKYTGISIPTPLFEKIRERIKGTGFKSVSDYIAFVLREIADHGKKRKEAFTKEDEEKIKKRLRSLGY